MTLNTIRKIWLYCILVIIIILFVFLKVTPDKSLNTENTGKTITGKVTKVKDGDTVVILPVRSDKSFTCRLYGIDTPEISSKGKTGQPYGDEADKELEILILGQIVNVTLTGDISYKREVCFIVINGMDINLEMVRRGYAWAYRQYLHKPFANEYIHAEKNAKSKRLGLWQHLNPQPPWEYRKMEELTSYVNSEHKVLYAEILKVTDASTSFCI